MKMKKKEKKTTPSNLRLNINIYWSLSNITPALPSALVCSDIDVVIRFIASWDNNAAAAARISLTTGYVPF